MAGSASDVAIPDIGDAEDVEVIEICVAVGDAVAANDSLIVIESDKASMEVPAPFAGTVAEVLVALGDHVNTGDPILRIEAAEGVDMPGAAPQPPDRATAEDAPRSVPAEPPPSIPASDADGVGLVAAPDIAETGRAKLRRSMPGRPCVGLPASWAWICQR